MCFVKRVEREREGERKKKKIKVTLQDPAAVCACVSDSSVWVVCEGSARVCAHTSCVPKCIYLRVRAGMCARWGEFHSSGRQF